MDVANAFENISRITLVQFFVDTAKRSIQKKTEKCQSHHILLYDSEVGKMYMGFALAMQIATVQKA
jgi:hypothetical protein